MSFLSYFNFVSNEQKQQENHEDFTEVETPAHTNVLSELIYFQQNGKLKPVVKDESKKVYVNPQHEELLQIRAKILKLYGEIPKGKFQHMNSNLSPISETEEQNQEPNPISKLEERLNSLETLIKESGSKINDAIYRINSSATKIELLLNSLQSHITEEREIACDEITKKIDNASEDVIYFCQND